MTPRRHIPKGDLCVILSGLKTVSRYIPFVLVFLPVFKREAKLDAKFAAC